MKRRHTSRIVAALVALAAAASLAACDLDDLSPGIQSTAARTAVFATSGTPSLVVRSSNGAVTVRGVPGQEDVQVTATLRSRGQTLDEADERISRIVLHMTQEADRITLSYIASEQDADVRKYSGVEFSLTVPAEADATIDTSNGAVAVSGVTGILKVDTSNGQIAVDHFTGELQAETSNGQIIVSSGEAALRLVTSNGAILMSDLSASVDARTSNGLIRFSGDLAPGTHRMVTSNGQIRVEVPATSAISLHADTGNQSIGSDLPWVGDTSGTAWDATLNAPATADLTLSTSNGSIWIGALP
jgi:hypothetical protein